MTVLTDAVGLLERAIGYALGSVTDVTPGLLPHTTPCAGWDLRMLLSHVNDSLAVLHEGIDTGRVGYLPSPGDAGTAADPAATFRDRAVRLLGSWAAAGRRDCELAIADRPLSASVMAVTGAIEIAVHGWDVSQACGCRRPIPPRLAFDMLAICRLLVTDTTRHPQFAAPVAVSPLAEPGDRLVAFLGRNPYS